MVLFWWKVEGAWLVMMILMMILVIMILMVMYIVVYSDVYI